MNLSAVIVDDEYLAIDVLKKYASQVEGLVVTNTFTDPRDAIQHINENKTDILFLDIQMPYISGLEFVNKLAFPSLIIFTTARNEYAVKAFELDVLDYLVKPISFERFETAVHKAARYLQYRSAPGPEKKEMDFLMIRADHRIVQIALKDIIYIEGLSEYVKIHCPDKKYITLASLKELEQQLPAKQFLRIHKSYLIARSQIASYTSSLVKLTTHTELPIGRRYKDSFLKNIK